MLPKMVEPELLATLKALSDPSRLRIAGMLAHGRRLSAEELAQALDLAPATVVHHLKRLREAGLVTEHARPPHLEHELRLDRLAWVGRELDRIGRHTQDEAGRLPGLDGRTLPGEDAKVLRAFLVDGRLTTIPAQHKKRLVILTFLARTHFRSGEELVEKQVNMRLALRHPDVAALRRYLVDEGFMERSSGVYRLLPEDRWPSSEAPGRE